MLPCKVCPVILGLTEAESDDLRTEAVALLSKVSNEKKNLDLMVLAMKLSNVLSDGTFDRTRDVGEAISASEKHPVHMLGLRSNNYFLSVSLH